MCYHLRPPTRCHCQLKNFWTPAHQRFIFDSFIYSHYAPPPYSARIVITASVYGKWVIPPILFFCNWHSFVELKTVTEEAFLAPQSLEERIPPILTCIFKSHVSQNLVEFCSLCGGGQRSSTQHLQRMGKNSSPILSCLWTIVY